MAINVQPSETVLDEVPQRALKFLSGVGTSPIIRSQLAAHGYTAEEHAAGWALLHQTAGYAPDKAAAPAQTDTAVQQAVNEIDAWDEPNFDRIQAALLRKFRPQAEFLFDNLAASSGMSAVLGVATLLDRLDALESGTGRKATHKEDLGAIKLLAERGYTAAERKRLRGLVEVAQRGTPAPAADAKPSKEEAQREAVRLDLYYWFKDWATTARTTIKSRRQQIRLGLAKPQKRDKAPAVGDGTGAAPATDVAAAGGATK